MNSEKIAVLGAGTMGNGIAHVFAQNGFETYLYDVDPSIIAKAFTIISLNLDRQIKKGIITVDQKDSTLSKIHKIVDLSELPKDISLAVEAVTENKEIKLDLLSKLHKHLNPSSIIASNTSSISITELGAKTRPDKFIGMHFMNPVPVMKLVEVIRGYATSNSTYQYIIDLCSKVGKTPVTVNDYPGFISNRLLLPFINEAVYALYEGVASKEDIDTVMKLGMNHPMGPLTLADFIGLDVCLNIMDVLYKGFNDSKYRPCPLLKKMVAAGKLGRKSGEGFFKY